MKGCMWLLQKVSFILVFIASFYDSPFPPIFLACIWLSLDLEFTIRAVFWKGIQLSLLTSRRFERFCLHLLWHQITDQLRNFIKLRYWTGSCFTRTFCKPLYRSGSASFGINIRSRAKRKSIGHATFYQNIYSNVVIDLSYPYMVTDRNRTCQKMYMENSCDLFTGDCFQ